MAIVSGLTIDDYEKLPDALALNHELVDGELVDVSGNTGNHNALRGLIEGLLMFFVNEHKLGRVLAEQEYKFGDNAYGPDVSFFRTEKLHFYEGDLRVQRFVPDLAIEIVSQNDRFDALMKKAHRYREHGTKEVWIFSIALRQAYIYSDSRRAILDENEQFSTDLIPGFSIRIGELFDRIQ
jgi:Uma2 family endonuclease